MAGKLIEYVEGAFSGIVAHPVKGPWVGPPAPVHAGYGLSKLVEKRPIQPLQLHVAEYPVAQAHALAQIFMAVEHRVDPF